MSGRGGRGAPSPSRGGSRSGSRTSSRLPAINQKTENKEEKSDAPKPKPDEEMFMKMYSNANEMRLIAELKQENMKLTSQLSMLRDKYSLLESSNKSYRESTDAKMHALQSQISEGESHVAQLAALLKQKEEQHQQTVARIETRHDKEMTETKRIIDGWERRKKDIDEFEKRRFELERRCKENEEKLENAIKTHTLEITDLENQKHVIKTRMRYAMIRKIKETKNNLIAKTKDQLHTTTKRVIMENEQMTTELHYQSKETEKILDKLDKTVAENKRLKQELQLQSQECKMLAHRTHFLKKLIDKLNEKLKIVDKHKIKPADVAVGGLDGRDQRIHELETRMEELEEAVRAARKESESGQQELQQTRLATSHILSIQDEGTALLLAALEDLKSELQESKDSNALPNRSPAERKRLIESLLAKLQSSSKQPAASFQ